MNAPRVVAMVSIHDEADIIVEVIENLLDNGLEVVALDHGSTDGSYELCSELASRRAFVLERWEPPDIDLEALTLRLFRMAQRRDPDWLLFSDGDEIHRCRRPGRTIHQEVAEAAAAGYNILQYDRFDFFMTDADDLTVANPVERLRHYSWQGDFNYRVFRNVAGLTAFPSFAHVPQFPPGVPCRVAPVKLVLRHYPYRSRRHAERKLANLLGKFDVDPAGPQPWHARYRRIAAEGLHVEPADHRLLARYDEGGAWRTERLHAPFTDYQPVAGDVFTKDGELRNRRTPRLQWDTLRDGAEPESRPGRPP